MTDVDDPDHIITKLVGITLTNEDLFNYENDIYYDVKEHGSINTYMNAKALNNTRELDILQRSGFVLSHSDTIMYYVTHCADVDCMGTGTYARLIQTLSHITDDAIVEKTCTIDHEHESYRCFDIFFFTREYTFYEYEKWFGSMWHLLDIYDGLYLIGTLNISEDETITVMKTILPNIEYMITDNKLMIKLKNLHE